MKPAYGVRCHKPAILSVRLSFRDMIGSALMRHRWILTKLVPPRSQLYETLHFLLDHPRRCFIYLFPSHQTWFLLTTLIIMT